MGVAVPRASLAKVRPVSVKIENLTAVTMKITLFQRHYITEDRAHRLMSTDLERECNRTYTSKVPSHFL